MQAFENKASVEKISRKSKKGFTLLEVLLATAILVIASTMIMKGFISVMIFAHNNANYAQQGSENYMAALENTIINYSTQAQSTTVSEINALPDEDKVAVTMTVTKGTGDFPTSDLHVAVNSYTEQNGLVDADGNAYVIDGVELDSSTVASNRFAFFYDFGKLVKCPNGDDHPVRYGYIMFINKSESSLSEADQKLVTDYDGNRVLFGYYCFEGASTSDDDSDDCDYYANCVRLG